MTGCEILDVLEAAHIRPYRGLNDHNVQNGLLLRADVHTLFDLDLIGIHPDKLTVELNPLIKSEYQKILPNRLKISRECLPSRDALGERYALFLSQLSSGK